MAGVSVKEFERAWWTEVYNRIIGAAVFIDGASAECLHWNGDLYSMLTAGAVSVKALSPFEFARKEHKKGVFITQATSTQLQTIRDIIKNSDFSHCILISTVSLDIVYLEKNEGKDVSDVIAGGRAHEEAIKCLENLLIDWINKKPNAVEVVHTPIFTISVTNGIFVTPPLCKVFPKFNGEFAPRSANIDLHTLSVDEKSQARRLASGLNSLFESLNIREEVFHMGIYSSIIAGILDNSPICLSRRKTCSNVASLIIVDRSLDMCGPTSHSLESVLDKVKSILPKFPGHMMDVAVNMSEICEANVIGGADDIQISPGCLYHANDDVCVQTFCDMLNKSQKDVMYELYNKLYKLDVQKSPGPKTLKKITPQSVDNIILATKGNYDVIRKNLGLIQQSMAVIQMVKSPLYQEIELVMNLEKQLVQNIAASRGSTSALNQISLLIKERNTRNLSFRRLMTLMVHVYSLIGTEVEFRKQHEQLLAETIGNALFEDHSAEFPPESSDYSTTPEMCNIVGRGILGKAKQIALIRKDLVKYKSLLKPNEAGTGDEYKGLLQQLMEDIVDPKRPELCDLEHRNEGLRDLLRSGFNMLTNKKLKPPKHPMDSPLVILFVVGGVTADECNRLHRTVMSSGVDAQFLIGSTKMMNQLEAMNDILSV